MNISFLIPSRNRPNILEDCLHCILQNTKDNDEIIVAIHKSRDQYSNIIKKYHNKVIFIYVDTECSLAYLWNQLIIYSSNEYVCILNDKARINSIALNKGIDLIKQNYALVQLYRFGCFLFSKYIIYKIGWFDEQLVDGGYEDCDFIRRLAEANLGYSEEECIDYIYIYSTWSGDDHNAKSYIYFHKKWAYPLTRLTGENEKLYKYIRSSYSKYTKTYLPFSKSIVLPQSQLWKDDTINLQLNKSSQQ